MLISKYGNGSIKLVEEFEKRYGIELDEQYRHFLINYNGGDTPKTTVRTKGVSSDLRYLFGINTEESIEDYLKIPACENNRCLPIGMDSFGNYYFIGLADDDKGIVYFCNHEKGYELTRIADSFSKFLAMCKSERINPRSQRSPEEREAELIANGKSSNITDGIREIWKREYDKYKDMIQENVIVS